MPERNENTKATTKKVPEGAVNMHKASAMGLSRKEAEDKALTTSQVEKKER